MCGKGKPKLGPTKLVAGALLLAAMVGTGPANAKASSGLDLVQVRQSLLGTHQFYAQTHRDVTVLGGFVFRHIGRDGSVRVQDGRLDIASSYSPGPAQISRTAAETRAVERVGGTVRDSKLAILREGAPRLVWEVEIARSIRVLIDADSGAVVKTESLVRSVEGTGRVFDPNPVVKLQDQSLTDQEDSDTAVPAAAYDTVTLHNLDGSGFLTGAHVNVVKGGRPARSRANTFDYTRSDDRFEQVVAYHAIDTAQVYLQSLGFTDVNNEAQEVKVNASKADQSHYLPDEDSIELGSGGVDDAEDVEVIWHELGHAIQHDQVPEFALGIEARSLGEGFSDYLALTMSQANSADTATTPLACVMDWDAVSSTFEIPHCLNRADTGKRYPEDYDHSFLSLHANGQIWSHALYDINRALGRDVANRVIIEAQFSFAPNTTFAVAAQATVAAAQALYGSSAAETVRSAFEARGIL